MPRAAIIHFNESNGMLEVLHRTGVQGFEPTEAGMAKLCRFLRALSPILPPAELDRNPDGSIVDTGWGLATGPLTEEEIKSHPSYTQMTFTNRAQNAPKKPRITREQLLKLTEDIDL